MHVRINLDGAPRGKGRGRAVATKQGARVYTDAKTRTYEAQLRFAGMQAMAGRAPSELPVLVTITVGCPIPASWSRRKHDEALAGLFFPTTKPDWDNIAKISCDSLNGIVYLDDKQIVNGNVFKVYSDCPGLSIEISEIDTGRMRLMRNQPIAPKRQPELALR